MEEKAIFSIEDTKKFTQNLVENCKKELREYGTIPRLAYLFIAGGAVPKMTLGAPFRLVEIGTGRHIDVAEIADADFAGVVLDLEGSTPSLINYLGEVEPRFAEAIPSILKAGRSIGLSIERASEIVIENWKRLTGMTEANLVTLYMRTMIERFQPYAYVTQSDAHLRALTEAPKGIPSEAEAIVITIEAKHYRQGIIIPYTRDASGKVVAFEDAQTIDSPQGFLFGALSQTLEN
jgi:hypothetical protein